MSERDRDRKRQRERQREQERACVCAVVSQLFVALSAHIHAFKLLLALLTDVIVKYVSSAFRMRC